jgi:hypothetical protein
MRKAAGWGSYLEMHSDVQKGSLLGKSSELQMVRY